MKAAWAEPYFMEPRTSNKTHPNFRGYKSEKNVHMEIDELWYSLKWLSKSTSFEVL